MSKVIGAGSWTRPVSSPIPVQSSGASRPMSPGGLKVHPFDDYFSFLNILLVSLYFLNSLASFTRMHNYMTFYNFRLSCMNPIGKPVKINCCVTKLDYIEVMF